MKLNSRKIRYIIQKKQTGVASMLLATQMKVSKRRVGEIGAVPL
ncbi:MAG: hypothetical protein ACP5FL_07485 [Thermoplasmatota archaeon]